MRLIMSVMVLSGLSVPAAAQAVPDGLCEIVPAHGGYHMEIARRFLPPESRGVRVNAMAIDCETLKAAEAGEWGRPNVLFIDARNVSTNALPTGLTDALDEFERRFADQDLIGRDDSGVYIAQRSQSLSGASAYTSIDGVAHIFTLVELGEQDAVDRSWRVVAEFARIKAR